MNTKILLVGALVGLLTLGIVQAPHQESVATKTQLFKAALKHYFSPVINGWGLGFDCDSDDVIKAKFHVVNVRTLPKERIRNVLQEAREQGETDWATIRDRIKQALEESSNVLKKGRIQIGEEKYLLTNIETGDTLSADIKEIPDYRECKQMNKSYEECEDEATKVGDVSITRRTETDLPKEPKFWVGTLNYNDNEYKFAALAYPKWGK